jgi:hypothetical protein
MSAFRQRFLLFVLLLPCSAAAFSQASLSANEKRIALLFSELKQKEDAGFKQAIADSLRITVKATLALPGAFEYPFSAAPIGKITSSDNRIRFYTWNIPYMDGHTDFFGFVQVKQEDKTIALTELQDKSRELTAPETLTLPASQWFGMLVYDIVVRKSAGLTSYTLLGFANEDYFVSRKAVDILTIDPQGMLWFGKPVFRVHGKMQSRLIFRYSSKARMSLVWNEKQNMIIFDHLSPSKPQYQGNFQYYGPDLSFDALRFENGFWELTEDVDIRNTDPGF